MATETNKAKTNEDVLNEYAQGMRIERGDLFEFEGQRQEVMGEFSTYAVRATFMGNMILHTYKEVAGRVPEPSDLAMLNMLGRAMDAAMRAIGAEAEDMHARNAPELIPAVMEAAVAACMMGFMRATSKERMESMQDPSSQVVLMAYSHLAARVGARLGETMGDIANGKRPKNLDDSVESVNNGGIVVSVVQKDETEAQRKADMDRGMAVAQAMAQAARGKAGKA